jgi:hypothetical protein
MRQKVNLKIDTSFLINKKKVNTPDINRRSNNTTPVVKKHRVSIVNEGKDIVEKKRVKRK